MENLKILSMNLGKRYISVRNRNRKQVVAEFVNNGCYFHDGSYDVIMLQGDCVGHNIDLNHLEKNGYKIYNSNNKAVTLSNYNNFFSSSLDSRIFNVSTLCYENKPLALVNINCKDIKYFTDVCDCCKKYSDSRDEHYIQSRIITGRLPSEVDTNEFCDIFDLEDVSTLVAMDSYKENNREMLNHFFISRNLECNSIHKLVGMT